MRLIIAILISLISIVANAGTHIVFINGIDGNLKKSDRSAEKILTVLRNTDRLAQMGGETLSVSFWYNPGDGAIDDKAELFAQAAYSSIALREAKKIDPLASPGSALYKQQLGKLYFDLIENGLGDSEEARHIFSVVKSFGAFLSTEVKTLGNSVIVVAHSQGNFFTEAVDAYLKYKASSLDKSNFEKNLKFVGAASVAASTPNGRYISIGEDKALDAHAAATINIPSFTLLPRNSDICELIDVTCYPDLLAVDPPSIHGFLEIYTSNLKDRRTGKALAILLSDHIYQSYIEISEKNCGRIGQPEIFEQLDPPPLRLVAGVKSQFILATNPIEPYSFAGYRWSTSEGVELLTNIPKANITFSSAGAGWISATPVLADGTVCTGSAATSSVTVTGAPLTACTSPVKAVAFTENFATPLDLAKWTVSESGGSVRSGGGSVTLSTVGAKSQFPSIATVTDVIPATGNFSLFCRAKYTNTGPYGAGACVATRNLVAAAGDANYGGYIGVWGGGGSVYMWGFDVDNRQIYYADIAGVNDAHDYETCVINGEVTAYVDGKLIARAPVAPERLRPRRIWLGHPGNAASPNTWVTVETSKIEVRELQ